VVVLATNLGDTLCLQYARMAGDAGGYGH